MQDPPAADVPLVIYHINSVLVVIVGMISSVRASPSFSSVAECGVNGEPS